METKKTIYRIYIQPQSQLENQPALEDLMKKHGDFAKQKKYHLSTLDLSITNISSEDNKNQFLYDLLLACITINKKLDNEWDMVLFFIKGIPRVRGIATGWASILSFKELILLSKIFKSDFEVNFMFDLPQKSHARTCQSMEEQFKEVLKDDYYLEEHELGRLKRAILSKSGVRKNKLNALNKYLDQLNNKKSAEAKVTFNFFTSIVEEIDYPYTAALFDEDETVIDVTTSGYELKID